MGLDLRCLYDCFALYPQRRYRAWGSDYFVRGNCHVGNRNLFSFAFGLDTDCHLHRCWYLHDHCDGSCDLNLRLSHRGANFHFDVGGSDNHLVPNSLN